MNLLEKLKNLALPQPIAVVGLGTSGKAALHLLEQAGYEVRGLDEKEGISFDDPQLLKDYATWVVSPGIDRRRPAFSHPALVINDIELFARLVESPVLAVTGSNGKSTVVSMLAHVLNALGKNVCLCGNIGLPVLQALDETQAKSDVYVLELSSYQLELCPSLDIAVGSVLNVTPDHLDRYDSLEDYAQAKANLAKQSRICVLNAQDNFCQEMAKITPHPVRFNQNGVNYVDQEGVFIDGHCVMRGDELSVKGRHNLENALSVLLMLRAFGCAIKDVASALASFQGLAHRMTMVAQKNGMMWIDDSKATNIGATIAALSGVHAPMWLILGGQGKGQDFSWLAQEILSANVKGIMLIGVDNRDLESALTKAHIDYVVCHVVEKAVAYAFAHGKDGDWVLLSPATASLDQFKSYAHRGDAFKQAVLDYEASAQ